MRRLVIAGALALVLVVGALAAGLSILRATLTARARAALGRSVAVARVAPSLAPLGVRLSALTVAEDPRHGRGALATAESLLVGVRFWPLLGGRIEVDRVSLRAGTVVIRRWARDRPLVVGDVRARATRADAVIRVDTLSGTLDGHPWTGAGTVDMAARRARLALRRDAAPPTGEAPPRWLPRAAELALAVEEDGATRVDGGIVLDDFPLAVRGRVLDLEPLALDLQVSGRPYGGALKGRIAPGRADGALRVRAVLRAVDVGAAADRLGADDPRVEGRAAAAVALVVEPGVVTGRGVVRLADGRVRGVNLVRDVFAALARTPVLRAVVGGETRRRHPALFAADDTIITQATVPFVIGDDRIVSDAIHVVGAPYEVVGRGTLDARRRLRFRGDLVVAAGVAEALVRDLRVLVALRAADGRLVVPFQLRGPLDALRVEPDLERLGTRGLAAVVEGLRDAGKDGAGGLADVLRGQLDRWRGR